MLLDGSGLCGGGRQRSEKTVHFAAGASRKEQRRGRTSRGPVSEGQRPESINRQNRTVGILHKANKFASEAAIGRDLAAAEIAHKYGVAEEAEIARRPNHSPRGIQPGTVLKMADVSPGGLVKFDEAKAIAGHIVVLCSVLLGVGDEKGSTDVLYVEWGE